MLVLPDLFLVLCDLLLRLNNGIQVFAVGSFGIIGVQFYIFLADGKECGVDVPLFLADPVIQANGIGRAFGLFYHGIGGVGYGFSQFIEK